MGHAGAPSATGTVITVFGAKGGVGKSTVSTNLAVSLAAQGASTAIIDLDTGFGDVTAMLNITAERTMLDLVRELDTVDRAELRRFMTRHEATGLDVLASPEALEWRQIPPDDIRRAIELLARYYDKVVIDTSGSISEVSEVALDLATIVLWVTTTEFTSVRDSLAAMRALESLSLPKERTRFVLNSVSADDNVRAHTVRDVLQRDVFWRVPYDKRVRQGTHFGQPICLAAPRSVAARSFADLATVIAGGRVEGGGKRGAGITWRPGMRQASAEN
jgi:pilus assembly protein CpaE